MNGNFKNTRRSQDVVLPSGVAVTMLNLIGEHQAMITHSDEKKRKSAIDEMMLGCCTKIGDKTNITLKDIDKLLVGDRAWFLFELRKFSNRRSPNFIFDYEFPVDANGSRRKQRYEVIFTREDFPQRPYQWVMEKMVFDFVEKNGLLDANLDEQQKNAMLDNEFPVMYNSYDEMLQKHLVQTVKLDDAGINVTWNLLTVEREKEYSKLRREKDVSSHDQLLQRKPVYNDGEYEDGKPLPVLPINDISQDDIEQLRESIMKVEANVDTTVVIQFGQDGRTSTQLNLITVPAFFFPSLAN